MTGTTEAVWIPQQYSDEATVTYRSNVMFENMLDHRWEHLLAPGMGNTANIPGFTQNNAAKNRGAGTGTFGTGATTTFDANTEVNKALAINRYYYKANREPVEIEAQHFARYITYLMDGAAQAVALQSDADIASDSSNGLASATTTEGTDNVALGEDNLLNCETNLNNNNAKEQDRFTVLSPASRQDTFKIESVRSSFNQASMGNLNGASINQPGPGPSGHMGKWMSLAFWTSNNLAAGTNGKKCAVFQREFAAFARQITLQTRKTLNIQDGNFEQYITYITTGFLKIKDNHATLLAAR